MSVIQLEGVTKRYGATWALRSIDLTVESGEVVSVLGPNGAGKTTAIHVLLGLRAPTQGSVRIFGFNPRDQRARARIGVMLQDTGVPESLHVKELVRLFQSYYPYTLPTDELLQRADLQAKGDARIDTLSGGQKQRLAFALALAGDPDLLFLDEPTAALDVEARRAFWEQVGTFADRGKTILFTTHHLDEADANADRVVVIHRGTILTQGTPTDIKGLVDETEIRVHTDLPLDAARTYPGVRAVRDAAGQLVVVSTSPEAFLQRLFAEGYSAAELSVQRADLEQAFRRITTQEDS
jgi:ABC-2 type transport system ATP-binding protein